MHSRHHASLLRDLGSALKQQMFFWGRDVIHPDGNLLVRHGFHRTPSPGLQGTSCYGMVWQDGRIELHGACAGWYPRAGNKGFVYIRPHGRCHLWHGATPPVPGHWPEELIETAASEETLLLARPFLDWWLHYELGITETAPSHRDECHPQLRKLPKGKPWLPPATAMRWIASLRDDPVSTPRAKRFVAPSA